MKRPLTLLIGIIVSIIILSFIFPSDPQKQDIINKIRNTQKKPPVHAETVRSYRVGDILKVDDSGNALVWSLDERYIYYSKQVKDDEENIHEEIWVSDLEGNKEKIDSKLKLVNIRNAKWSPDGKMLCFISGTDDNKNGIFLYDVNSKAIRDITPKNTSDVGVTSYDWDTESLYIIMSLDIVKPRIDIYNISSQKYSRLDMKLNSCRNVAFYSGGRIIFSDKDENSKFKIYSADRSGKNIDFIVDGQNFVLSPDKDKIAILSDADSQDGLWIYNVAEKQKNILNLNTVNNIYWLSNSTNFIYSMLEDCISKYTYTGNLYFLEKDLKITEISGAVHTIFVPSYSGNKIAITSPEYMEDKMENKGVFIGELYR